MEHQLFGVIEGFYGDPWSQIERLAIIDALAGWGQTPMFGRQKPSRVIAMHGKILLPLKNSQILQH